MLKNKWIKQMAEGDGASASTAAVASAPAPAATPAAASAPPSAPAAAPSSPTSGASTDTTGSQAAATPSSTSEPAPAASTTPPGGTAPVGAPEAYTFTAPEGLALDDVVMADFSRVAKELNLTQDAAQKIVSEIAPKMAAQQLAALNLAYQNQVANWIAESKADKDIGGDKMNENLAVAAKARDTFATPELRKYLDDTGLANHPQILKMFVSVGKAISEDRMVPGGGSGANAQGISHKSVLYGDGVKIN